MPTYLELYPGKRPPLTAINTVEGLDRDALPVQDKKPDGRQCDKCKLSTGTSIITRCIGAEGDPGGLLVVGEGPGRDENMRGRPFVGVSGQLLRQVVGKWWKGPVAFDNATRCYPAGEKKLEKPVAACRGFLKQTIQEVAPQRIVCVGSWSALSVLGRTASPFSNRRGYSYIQEDNWVDGPVPVFMVIHPAAALRNRFVRQWFEADMKWALTCDLPEYGPWHEVARVVADAQDAEDAFDEFLERSDWISFDVETAGVMWTSTFCIISVAVCGSHSDSPWVWPFEAINDPAMRGPLMRLLMNKRLAKTGANVKYDQLAERSQFGIVVTPITIDVRLLRKLLEPEASGALSDMSELVGMGGYKQELQAEKSERLSAIKRAMKPNAKTTLEELGVPPEVEAALRLGADPDEYQFFILPRDTLHRYNGRDAVATKRLVQRLTSDLAQDVPSMRRTWDRLVRPASVALERVEAWGVPVDKRAIEHFDTYLEGRESKARATLDLHAPGVLWTSPKQVAEVLFDRLRLKPLKLTETGQRSTDEEVLQHLAKKHPLPAALVEHRFITRMRSTYASGMYQHVRDDRSTGYPWWRIHPNVKLDGARSGRTSCTDPNLQNIPRASGSAEGKMARDCFAAPPGYKLVELDYSQLELRVAALLSGDPKMKAIFNSGLDYHQRTAELVSKIAWGLTPEQLTKEHRTMAKAVNFGVLYGKGAGGLADEWGCTVSAAQAVIDAIMGEMKVLDRWCDDRLREAQKTGFVWTWWDGETARRRPLWRVADKSTENDKSRSVAENGAVNSPIQGTASDFCIASLTACVDWLEQDAVPGTRLVLPVHDALMFEVRDDMVDEVAHTAAHIMRSWPFGDVPLVVDCKVGQSWGTMQDYDVAA